MRLLRISCLLPGVKHFTILGALFLFPMLILAQSKTISGTVKDENGKFVASASVTIKNLTTGTTTNELGQFSILAVKGQTILIKAVNFETLAVIIGNQTSINATLKSTTTNLDDVIVVGYATQKKVNLTGAVATVTAKQIENRPIVNLSSSLGGLLPGVYIAQTSGKPGSDGANIVVRGRGTLSGSSPLIVIDGVIGSLDAVNPLDVETVTVLKDAASASIYGSQSGNGVVLVTTKKGQKNKTTITYNGVFSSTAPMNLPQFVTNYADNMRYTNEAHTNVGQAAKYSGMTINAWDSASKIPNSLNPLGVPNYIAYPNTDWVDALFSNNLTQNHNISINGGSDKSTYLFSIGYLNNQGTIQNTWSKRYQLRANIEAKVNKFLTVGTQTFALFQENAMGNTSGAFNFLRQTTPGLVPFYDNKYGFAQTPEENQQANNILSFLNNTLGKDQTSRFNTSVYANVAIVKGLSFESRFNYQMRQNEFRSRTNPDAAVRWNFASQVQQTFAPDPSTLSSSYGFDKNYQITIDNVLRYTTTIATDHTISAFAGYNQLYYNLYNLNASKQGMVDYSIYVPSAVLLPTSTTGTESDWAIRSLFGRVNYSFKGKYLLEGNIRRDAVSRFSPDSRVGIFPSASAGWRISEENFMKNVTWVSNLKLRASYGDLGSYASGLYDWQSTYSTRLYSFNNVQASGLAVGRYSNNALQWESTNVKNIGIDASFFGRKLNVELDVFRRNTAGILSTISIPITAGIASAPTVNLAGVQNQGLELSLGTSGNIGKVGYSISGNFAITENVVTKYRGKLDEKFVTDANGVKVYQSNLGAVYNAGALEGKMIGEHYVYNVYKGNGKYFNADGTVNIAGGPKDGMIRTEDDINWVKAMLTAGYKMRPGNAVRKDAIWYGDLLYADLNGDGDYGNSYDRSFTGTSTLPKYVFGFNAEFTWNGFDIFMLWSGATGMQYQFNADGYNNSYVVYGNAINASVVADRYYYNETNPADPNNNINAANTRLKVTDGQNKGVSSNWWLYDAGWMKLKNVQIGYNLPNSVINKMSIQKARIYFSGENLLLFTKYPGLDPEIGSGIDYPTMKQYAFGINVTF